MEKSTAGTKERSPDSKSLPNQNILINIKWYFKRYGQNTMKFNYQKTKWTWIIKKWQIIHPPPIVSRSISEYILFHPILNFIIKCHLFLPKSSGAQWGVMSSHITPRSIKYYLPSFICLFRSLSQPHHAWLHIMMRPRLMNDRTQEHQVINYQSEEH